MLNVEDCVQAVIEVVDGDRRMLVIGILNNVRVESYEVEEGLSEMKGGKAPGLDQCAVEILRKRGRSIVAWFVRLFNRCL